MALRLSRIPLLRQSCIPRSVSSTQCRYLSDLPPIPTPDAKPQYSHTRTVPIPNFGGSQNPTPILARPSNGTSATPPFYTVSRTPTRGLPVYEIAKAGGTLKLTRVRKLEGNRERLKKDLELYLEPKPGYVKINPVTGHVIVKGWYKTQIDKFLIEQGF